MPLDTRFVDLAERALWQTVLPDLVLSFAFFTAIAYATLNKQFNHQRSAITIAGSIGLSLALGLVWWEQTNGLSSKDLGPLALVLIIIVLLLILYKTFEKLGGKGAGICISLAIGILVILTQGIHLPINTTALMTIVAVAFVIAFSILFLHNHGHGSTRLPSTRNEIGGFKDDLARLYRDRCLSKGIDKRMRVLRKETDLMAKEPRKAGDLLVQIQRILPAEGWLTQRMAKLREKAHRIRNGHISQLNETKHILHSLPAPDKKKAAIHMVKEYYKLIDMDRRLERMDLAVAENESRIRQLTQQARLCVNQYRFHEFEGVITSAQRLQKNNTKLFKTIERLERKLSVLATKVAKQASEVNTENEK